MGLHRSGVITDQSWLGCIERDLRRESFSGGKPELDAGQRDLLTAVTPFDVQGEFGGVTRGCASEVAARKLSRSVSYVRQPQHGQHTAGDSVLIGQP